MYSYDMIRKPDTSLRHSSLRSSNLHHSQDRENDIKKSKTLATSFLDLRRCSLTVGTTIYYFTLKVEAEGLSSTLVPAYKNRRRHISPIMDVYIWCLKRSINFWLFSYVTAFIFSINKR
jgi:hypothetical protein